MSTSREPIPDLHARFDELQAKLVPLWQHIGRTDPGSHHLEDPNTIVVMPSMTVDVAIDFPSQQGYEERMLFMLFLLRQPRIRLIYITSVPIPQEIVDYYLDLLPSVTSDHARRRLILVSPQDSSERPLVTKILDRPLLINHIRSLIPDLDSAHLVPFVTTELERELAVRLGLPMYAADPDHFDFGTKTGCRRLFAEEGLSYPIGEEDLHTPADLIGAISRMRMKKPTLAKVIVKLNEGVSGYGNAQLDLAGLPDPGHPTKPDALATRLKELKFELRTIDYTWYMDKLAEKGGIVEEMITGEVMVSPSAQLRNSPLGEVELLSTHDQMLGGPTGQVYLGARFPAHPEYGPMIMHEAEKIGKRLAKEGVVGRFALDFLVVRRADGGWDPYAIEINLRKGGTTHPFLTLQYLTDGCYDADSGVFYTALGHPKYYVATDTHKDKAYQTLTPTDLLDLVSNYRMHYDHITQTGIVLHMFSQVATLGKLGFTAIGNSPEHAEEIYQGFIAVLNEAVKEP
ncbi:MAG TPA: peptide ligase PGM1-related protein [Anaerolineales bacterium]|nr:peptide ligase PGM1-related protein [Anaerolineales bacterium]